MEDMKNIKHQGEHEDHIVNNHGKKFPTRKQKKKKSRGC
jgi:hypothetical protein